MQLEISLDGTKLAVANAADSQPTLRLYQIQYGAVPPLTQIGTWSLGGFSGYSDPGDVHFAPDGSFVFLSGGNGRFSLLDLTTTPPTLRSNAAVWSTAPATGFHGAGIAISNGAPVAVMGEEGSSVTVRYRLIDLNVSSSTYGTELTNFTTNAAGNISNHRLHGSQNIVVGIDGTGATADCQWVDVMDLDQPQPGGGFASWRVKMPTALSLTISGITSIPRDFSIY